uniref:Uncharacterized protein n=1 Tax=Aegilops tauschii subsp. strangulata TaxID=200361 RepID=A0A453DJB5_AEGTS
MLLDCEILSRRSKEPTQETTCHSYLPFMRFFRKQKSAGAEERRQSGYHKLCISNGE